MGNYIKIIYSHIYVTTRFGCEAGRNIYTSFRPEGYSIYVLQYQLLTLCTPYN